MIVILSGKSVISLGSPSTDGGGEDTGLTSTTLSVGCGDGNDVGSLTAIIGVEVNGELSASMSMSLFVSVSLSTECCWLLTERCISAEVKRASVGA